jgi:uncharacterized protein involved in type VI secretion and phage assembly
MKGGVPYRRVVVQLHEEDLAAVQRLRERWGLPSDAAAVRFALRIARDAVPTVRYNEIARIQTEVEK